MTQAVILAGGKGTRLASLLNGRPKCLVDVDGVPLLQRQIELLLSNGIDEHRHPGKPLRRSGDAIRRSKRELRNSRCAQ